MYRIQKTIKNVNASSFLIDDTNNSFAINWDGYVSIFRENEELTLKENGKDLIATIFNFGRILIADKNKMISFSIDEEGNTISNYEYVLASSNLENFQTDCFLYMNIYSEDKELNNKIVKVKKSNFEIETVYPNSLGFNNPKKIINNQIFISEDWKIKLGVFNFENELIWEQEFAKLAKSEKVTSNNQIIENQGKLYFSLNGGDNGRKGLFVLDVETGEEVAFYENATSFVVTDNEYVYSYKNDFCILKVNALTNELQEIPLGELLTKEGFDSETDLRNSTVENNILNFTQSIGAPNAKLGAVDLNTQQMLYKYDFPNGSGSIGSIQVHDGRIFVHTQDKTLHIFEKENLISN